MTESTVHHLAKEQFSPYDDPDMFYDPFYPESLFVNDVECIKIMIEACKKSRGNRLLDTACGTGRHIALLRSDFKCTGLDASKTMLSAATRRVGDSRLVRDDLRTFNLGERFDVITCLGGGIAYIHSESDLSRVTRNFFSHLESGGICIIDPWGTIESFVDGDEKMRTWDGKDQELQRLRNHKVARLNVVHFKEKFSVTDYHYLVATKHEGVRHFFESHRLRLFERKVILNALTEAGFESVHIPDGLGKSREAFMGIKS